MLPHESDTQETDPLRGAADLGDTYHLVKPGDEDLESRNRQSMVDPEVNNLVSGKIAKSALVLQNLLFRLVLAAAHHVETHFAALC